jgi:hypothetical protein
MSNCQRGVGVGDTTFDFSVQGGGGLANYAARMIALDRLSPHTNRRRTHHHRSADLNEPSSLN